jgi:ABC-type polysaccharide transport system permease subunit
MKKYFYILGAIQAFVALGAIPAGLGYLTDITGVGMGTSVELLKNSPLTSFLIPGLFLLIVHGFGNVFGAILSFKQSQIAGKVGFVLGLILSLWIIIQVYWIGLSSFMQPLFLGIGLSINVLSVIITRKIKRIG